MKQYKETQDGYFSINGMTIPNSTSNRHYNQMIQEVADAKAEIVPFDHEAQAVLEKINIERAWRNQELFRADIELNKVQDGEGRGLVSDWRTYRRLLRDYPESPNFPNGVRPSVVYTD